MGQHTAGSEVIVSDVLSCGLYRCVEAMLEPPTDLRYRCRLEDHSY